jgi:LmbE family N-acetylglucosaminyl deacetylase
MARPSLTLLCVHAHPDDESTSTGGILARYGAEGVRTIVVTCTNGENGDAPGGVKPGEPGHDPLAVAALRRAELEESCRILGVDELELLGFRDSGMAGWEQNGAPDAFAALPVEAGAARLVPLLERYRPDVVVTYDADGFYGHPDHVQAHRVTVAALERAGFACRLFFPVIPASASRQFEEEAEGATEAGEQAVDRAWFERFRSMSFPDEELAARVDCRPWAKIARAALAAHDSQAHNNEWALTLDDDRFTESFGWQSFASTGAGLSGLALPLDDVFSGIG